MGGNSKLRKEYIRPTCKAYSGSRADSFLEASRTRDNAIPKIFEVKDAELNFLYLAKIHSSQEVAIWKRN
jgi:hypothetical protein